jgi:hypothetical protein
MILPHKLKKWVIPIELKKSPGHFEIIVPGYACEHIELEMVQE